MDRSAQSHESFGLAEASRGGFGQPQRNLRALAQPFQKFLEIDPVFAVGLVDRVEGRDQAAGAMHAEIEGDSDARRRTLYDCVDNQLDGRERDLYHGASLRVWRCRLLC